MRRRCIRLRARGATAALTKSQHHYLKFRRENMKKTILVTGASSGFGLMLANMLHKQGHTVIGTSRDPERHASKVPFKLMHLDIDDDTSIQKFMRELFLTIKKLDVLVNNAGYMLTGLAEETPMDAARQQFETNFWGTVKVTSALLPYLREQRSGKIITVSSIVALIGPPNLAFYTASKHAIEGYFKSLRFELNPFNIQVSMVEPLWFKTNLGKNSVAPAKGGIAAYDTYRRKAQAVTQKGLDEAEQPDAVVKKISDLIASDQPKFSNPVGKMVGMFLFLQSYVPKMFESSILKSVATAR
ncbi:SDR family NAD(P)-dependent oxidoreductase [Xanthomonas citri]|uniref:SDR family NAD(P)-dependent oxidoreductase n=1 Tax=Xanthomonas citri TaxID=346 RepID=UPI0032E90EDE